MVAAEDFWGTIAAQLGGDRVAGDEHHHQPGHRSARLRTDRSDDARTLAGAQMAIVNGIGYDDWAPKLLAANPVHGPRRTTVGDLLGLEAGRQPAPVVLAGRSVHKVIAEIVADYKKLDPGRRLLRAAAERASRPKGWPNTTQLISQIKAQVRGYAGRRLGEHLRTAGAGARAEAADPAGVPGRDHRGHRTDARPTRRPSTTRSRDKQIKVWVFNSQNATPDVQRLNDAARKQPASRSPRSPRR